jgi:cystathionine beta-lyase/cystathionine gamma-synthase
LLYTIFGSFGVKTLPADFSDVENLREKVLEVQPRVLIGETISNPLLKVLDIEACAEIAQKSGAKLIIDNTFATPFLCQPINFGADFVVHSATKFLGGHADATGGIVVAREEFDRPALMGALTLAGGVLSAWEAHSILRGSFRGAVVGVRLKEDSREFVYRFMNALNLCARAASVGDIFTGIVHPATATHREM